MILLYESERIWQAILEFVAAITKVFSIDDEEVLNALVNESDECLLSQAVIIKLIWDFCVLSLAED